MTSAQYEPSLALVCEGTQVSSPGHLGCHHILREKGPYPFSMYVKYIKKLKALPIEFDSITEKIGLILAW